MKLLLLLFISLFGILQVQTSLTKNLVSANKITRIIAKVSLLGTSLISTGDAIPASTSILSQILSYLRFIDLPYSENAIEIFDKDQKYNNLLTFDMGIKAPSWLEQESVEEYLPEVFMKNGLTGNFLRDFWSDILFVLLIGAIMIIFSIILYALEKLAVHKKIPRFFRIFEKLQVNIKNLLVAEIYNNFAQVLLLFILQIKVLFNYSSLRVILNLCIASVLVTIGAIALTGHIWLAKRYQREKNQKVLTHVANNNRSWQVFIISYQDLTLSHQLCLVFLVTRALLSSLIIALCYNHQVLQISLLLVLNVSMLIFLLFKMPFKRRIDLVQQLCCEFLIMIANICVLIFAIPQYKNPNDDLNNVVILLKVVFYFIPIVFVTTKFVYWIFKSWKKRSDLRKNSKKIFAMTPTNLLRPSQITIKELKPMFDDTNCSSFNFSKAPNSSSKLIYNQKEHMEYFGTPRSEIPRVLMSPKRNKNLIPLRVSPMISARELDLGTKSPDSVNGSAISSLAFDGNLSPIKRRHYEKK